MTLPLQNKLFISTRPAGTSGELSRLLHEAGASLLEFPLIEIKAATLSSDEQQLFSRLEQFQWMILTSPNGVRYFFEFLQELTGSQKLPESLQIAVIGDKTSKTLEKYGYRAAFVNPGSTAEDFVEPFARHIATENSKTKIVLPLGNLARNVIQDHLEKLVDCTRIDIYQTEMPEKTDKSIAKKIETNRYDMLIFTSPSGIHHFTALFPKLSKKNIRMACIGDITAGAAREKGFNPLVVAQNSSSAGIVESILNHYISKT
ncbi:uroporphyrinogen-III synthase [Mariniphaga sp.]|uniref:uroporphyrinogen-III synthase n=1 Tax=Mariniphaga sp. TaxID=1954475 RepID=UPI0035692B74